MEQERPEYLVRFDQGALTQEPWGVRRFFVRDPHGVVVNVVAHAD